MISYLYSYDGPVMEFDKCIADHWQGATFAPTEARARSNLAYQFKKQFNRIAATRISLPGVIKRAGRKDDI